MKFSEEISAEFRRKAFHLVGLLIPILYWFLSKTTALWILGIVCVLYYLLEICRKLSPSFNQIYLNIAKPLLRESEHNSVAGTAQFLTGCWLTILFFDKPVAITATYLFIWSDLGAALIGKIFGKTKLVHSKSLEGTIGAFGVALLVLVSCKILLINDLSIITLCITSILCPILELFSKGNWDNFTIPIGTGLVMTYLPKLYFF